MHPFIAPIIDIAFPNICVCCKTDIHPSLVQPHRLCGVCSTRIHWRTAIDASVEMGFDALFAAGDFDGPLRELLHRFKYGGRQHLGRYLADQWLARCPFDPADIDMIMPVPMPRWKSWRRGYNQAALLAHEIGASWQVPVYSYGLTRRWWSVSQTKLGRRRRFQNAAKSFKLVLGQLYRQKTVLIIDDICTTGATLDVCARLLKSAGASRVLAGTIARDNA